MIGVPVHAVVNHLRFPEPLLEQAISLFAEEGVPRMRDAEGCLAAHVVRAGDDHLILVIVFEDAAAAERVTREIGSPWMRECIVHLLAAPSERRAGEVVASTAG